jgi:hypothetical protein
LAGPLELGPHGALESFVGAALAGWDMSKQVELGIASNLRMGEEELRELGIVAGDIVLVGEQRRVACDDGGEGGAEAEELDELQLGPGQLLFGGWSGRRQC